MDLYTTGSRDRKHALAQDLARKLLPLRPLCYSPSWEDLHINWARAAAPVCTLADAVGELRAMLDELVVGVQRVEHTLASLHFAIECYQDLQDVYGLDRGLWNGELYDLLTRLDKTTSPTEATALLHKGLPGLQRHLARSR